VITFGITVCDEVYEFKRLVDGIKPYINNDEKIVVLADQNKIDKRIQEYCDYLGIDFHLFDFQKDFSAFKNYLLSLVGTDYLFQIDADEQIPPSLIYSIRNIISSNPNCESIHLPRINIVNNIDNEDLKKYNWQTNDRGWIQFPDYQQRVIKKDPKIYWENKVHEKIVGPKISLGIPTQDPNIELYSILHVKDIEKQRKQNKLYEQITD
jgi:hypothetical protein